VEESWMSHFVGVVFDFSDEAVRGSAMRKSFSLFGSGYVEVC
jgi:hypothetical protein